MMDVIKASYSSQATGFDGSSRHFGQKQARMITLLTDFGSIDTYVGVMKGVIAGIAPSLSVVDITHAVTPQNVLEGSARWETVCGFFPAATVHVGVVDPGVGSQRGIVAVQTERALWLAPDNGLLTLPLIKERIERVVRLTEKAAPYCLTQVSATFHGRDVFAPVAAHLASGLAIEALGEEIPVDSLVRLLGIAAEWTQSEHEFRIEARVLYADRFGNLITNLHHDAWQTRLNENASAANLSVQVAMAALTLRGIMRTFADVPVGSPLLYWGSSGRLELAVREGSAADRLGFSAGSTLTLIGTQN